MRYSILILLFFISSNSFAQDSTLIKLVIRQLGLDQSKIPSEFLVTKVCPNNTKETIMVIPEVAEEEEDFFTLNSYILIVNNETGKIINKYFESSAWQSDAVILSEIIIDTAPYNISENNRAFGIRDSYYTRSQPNPYRSSNISLFIKSENKLKKVLSNYEVADYGGEWDMYCTGEFIDHNKTIIMTTDKTNGYYDILIKNKIKATKSYENENGDCDTTEEINRSKTTLKFNGEEYRENGSFAPIDVYLTDPDVNGTNVRQEPNGKIILKLKDDYFTLTITEAREGWFKLKKIIGVEGNNIEIPGGAAWVHHSVIGVSTRRKIKLLDKPKDGRVVGTIDQEIGVQVKDKYLDWVQVEYKGLIGWIASEWLCGNPVTTCP